MKNSILNITNGDFFYDYFIKKFGGVALPFCEAMMEGETVKEIYSDIFIKVRCKSLEVKKEEYLSKLQVLDTVKEYSVLKLWFGKDTFCQLNLLTLLAYLEQISYSGDVTLNYIDDETFSVLEENITVKLGDYQKIYEQVLILKEMPEDVGVLNKRAIGLYFDYLSPKGNLQVKVKENLSMDENALICLLLEETRSYGLSDLQIKKLIKNAKNKTAE